jgi:copper(I)-binding protein
MKKLIMLALLSVSTLFASSIEIKDAYVRATPPGLPNSAAFMTVINGTSKDMAIVKASSSIAKAVELHTHDMSNGVMRMYQVPKISIPKNSETIFQPGGFHVMFIGLIHPLQVGETVTFTFEFENGETKNVTAPIKSVMSGMNHKNMDHSKMKHSN